jgi:glycosyltransferase involved in cell wall biosynthesis
MSDIQISAIICTHNREMLLNQAIESLLSQDFLGQFEVIVVDNASTDQTRRCIDAWLPHPRLRYVYEPTLGLSVARNTGAAVARGAILAYLDDDAMAGPNWLKTLYAAFQADEALAIAGGKITLRWPIGVVAPLWLSTNLTGSLGAFDLGDRPCTIKRAGHTPRGANYAVRALFLQGVGGFNVNLGRVGNNLLSNEEVYLTEQALRLGWRVSYVPDAQVSHYVAPERLYRRWFLKRGWWQGVSECYREQIADRAGAGQLRRGSERLLRGVLRSLRYRRDPALHFDNLVYAYSQIGYLKEAVVGLLTGQKHLNPRNAIPGHVFDSRKSKELTSS